MAALPSVKGGLSMQSSQMTWGRVKFAPTTGQEVYQQVGQVADEPDGDFLANAFSMSRLIRLRQFVVRYFLKLFLVWLLLLLMSYQFSQVKANPFNPSPIKTVINLIDAEVHSYDLLLWSERRVPVRSSQFGDLRALAEHVGQLVGLDLDKVIRDVYTSGSTWVYQLSGRLDTDFVTVTAAWISPEVVAGNNQLVSIQVQGTQSELTSLQRKLQSKLARTTGRPVEAKVSVVGRFHSQGTVWELVSHLQRKLQRHPFSGLNIRYATVPRSAREKETALASMQTVNETDVGTVIEGWADFPGKRRLHFSITWEGEHDAGIVEAAVFPCEDMQPMLFVQHYSDE